MSEKSRFRGPFDKQHSKWGETLLKSEREHIYIISWSLWKQLSWQKSLLVISKILRLFFNALTSNKKYSLINIDNSTQPTQIQLSQKQKTFSELFSVVLRSKLNFEHL